MGGTKFTAWCRLSIRFANRPRDDCMIGNNDKPVVFVIDDDPSIREALDGLIRSIKLDVYTFGTTDEFLNFNRPDAPGCIVLDIRLPGINGLDFQRDLEKSNIDLPIIFITGHGDVPMSVRAIKAGAVEFLTKPFQHQDLVDAIYIGIERDRSRRQAMATVVELQHRFVLLTARERQIMQKVVSGGPNKKIAAELKLSEFTVKVHRSHVMQKMKAKSLVDLVRMADKLQEYTQTA
jgi:FixJ family two-component response regulator